MKHSKVIILVGFLSACFSGADTIQIKNKCFKMELVGGMVDAIRCKEVQVLLKNFECRTGEASGANRKMTAKLTKCSKNRAEGFVDAENQKVSFVAQLKDNPEFEVWGIAKLESPNGIDLRKKTPVALESVQEEPVEDIKSNIAIDGVTVEANWVAGFSPNKESIIATQRPAGGGYYGRSTLAVTSEQVYQNQLAFDYLSVTGKRTVNDKVDVEFSFSAGQKTSFWFSSPYGIDRGNSMEISDAILNYRTAPDSTISFGLWSDESIRNFESDFAFTSTAETFLTPHIYSGLRWQKESDTQFLRVMFVNGWNEIQDINNSFGVGVNYQKSWSENLLFDSLVYSGDEGSVALGTESKNLKHIDLGVVFRKAFKVQTVYGKWGSDLDYMSASTAYSYEYSSAETLSARYEYVKNKSAFLFSNGWESFYNVEFDYRRQVSEEFLFRSALNYSNSIDSGLVSSNPKNRFNFLVALTIKIE
ncbi:MAG: hypothetical protein B7Y39_11000 [Bdellovibrio sp. 28-41-41]|nr:MAG: hypothetical protein B7Y39_11000 [Bdellovibrio sp. 28-41-41]